LSHTPEFIADPHCHRLRGSDEDYFLLGTSDGPPDGTKNTWPFNRRPILPHLLSFESASASLFKNSLGPYAHE
jgi:hypothetical protein